MNTTLSLRLFAGAAIAAAIVMGGCMAQPIPQCTIAQPSTGITGYPQFWVKYTLKSGTGSCSQLTGEEVGFQSYINPKDDNDLKIAIRASGLSAKWSGNDSSEPVARVDPSDPNGKKINTVVKLTPYPDSSYVCKTTEDIPAATQNFQAETVMNDLDDGGTETVMVPAETVSYKWSDAKWISSPTIAGVVYSATLQYTVDTCTATYDALGVWPVTSCVTDSDCDPNPLPDAGVCDPAETDMASPNFCTSNKVSSGSHLLIGSGLNPDIKFKCDTDNSVCIINQTFESIVTPAKQ
jgi:hypothetical protein